MAEERVQIPATIEDAKRELKGLGQLLTATEWSRAAVIRAFTEKGAGHGGKARGSARFSFRDFARLGIAGLKSENTVSRYYDAWESTGRPAPEPGEIVKLPTQAFSDVAEGDPRRRNSADEVADKIKADPEWAAVAMEGLAGAEPEVLDEAAGNEPDLADQAAEAVGQAVSNTAPVTRPGRIKQDDAAKVLDHLTTAQRSVRKAAELAADTRMPAASRRAAQAIADRIRAGLLFIEESDGKTDLDDELRELLSAEG